MMETHVSEEPGVQSTEAELCSLEIHLEGGAISASICSVCFTFGLVYCFLGSRCFTMVLFLSGLVFGTVSVLLFHHMEPSLSAHLGPETRAGISLGVGVLCGLTAMLVPPLGLFLSGLQLGPPLALAPLAALGQFGGLVPAWAPLANALAVGVVGAVSAAAALRWPRPFSIVYTSVLGGVAVMLSVDHLLGGSVLPGQAVHMLSGQLVPKPLCWSRWVIMGIGPVLSLSGIIVQWNWTKGVAHRDVDHHNKPRAATLGYTEIQRMRRRRRRRRPGPRRTRRPPIIQRYAGDVLAPSYLQSLQEQQMRTGSSSSSSGSASSSSGSASSSSRISTITHTLIHFDFESGSMVPLTTTTTSSSTPVFTF